MQKITSITELDALYGEANPISLAKETTFLTAEYEKWIQNSSFYAIATSGDEGLDCSPRGDLTGQLLNVIHNRQIALPDRRGNNRLDTLRNIVRDPRVGILFFIPGLSETLRINGRAWLTIDSSMIDRFDIDGKKPKSVIMVDIDAVYFQCARAIIRSNLWNKKSISNLSDVPSAGQMIKSAKQDFDASTYDATLPERQKTTLY